MQDAANSAKIIQGISDAAAESGKRMDSSIRIDGGKFSSDAAHVNREIAGIGDQAAVTGASIESAFKKARVSLNLRPPWVKVLAGRLRR